MSSSLGSAPANSAQFSRSCPLGVSRRKRWLLCQNYRDPYPSVAPTCSPILICSGAEQAGRTVDADRQERAPAVIVGETL